MTTIIERDPSGPAGLLIFVVVLLLLAGGVWFAFTNGVFGEKTTVIENNKTVEVAAPANTPAAPKP